MGFAKEGRCVSRPLALGSVLAYGVQEMNVLSVIVLPSTTTLRV